MELLIEKGLNDIGIGPQGLSGTNSVMGVHIENLSIPKTPSGTETSQDQRHADTVTGIHPSGQKRELLRDVDRWASQWMPSLLGRTGCQGRTGLLGAA